MREGFEHFGIRAMVVEFIPLGILFVEKKYKITFVKASPTVPQQCIKKLTLKPSGPRHLFLFIPFSDLKTSEEVIGTDREAA